MLMLTANQVNSGVLSLAGTQKKGPVGTGPSRCLASHKGAIISRVSKTEPNCPLEKQSGSICEVSARTTGQQI